MFCTRLRAKRKTSAKFKAHSLPHQSKQNKSDLQGDEAVQERPRIKPAGPRQVQKKRPYAQPQQHKAVFSINADNHD
jgi:hypothetical protein